MREAPVGWQCQSCVRQGAKVSPTIRWRPGQAGRLGNTRMTPVVGVIIGLCTVIYLAQRASPTIFYSSNGVSGYCQKINCRYELIPSEVHHGQYYRLITSAFLHASPEHIILNMISLAIIGPAVEAEIGWARFVALYLLSALGGSVISYLLEPAQEQSLGASGAIFGIMGAYYILARHNRWETSSILGLLIVNLIYSFVTPGIAWQDHLGGLATGVALMAAVAYGPSAYRHRSAPASAAVTYEAACALLIVVVLGLLVMLPPGHVNL